MPAEGKKPPGWKSATGIFWLRVSDGVAQQRCKQCLRISAEGCPPILAHERTCDEYPRSAAVKGPDLPAPPESIEREYPIEVELRRVDKPRARIRDRGYLAFVRDLACCSCGAPGPSNPHHWSATVRRGVGQKVDDLLTVPLCRRCHSEYHSRNALPGKSKDQTTVHLLGVQVELLVNWIAERKLAEGLDRAVGALVEEL